MTSNPSIKLTPQYKAYCPVNRLLSAPDSIDLATWVSESLNYGARVLLIDLRTVSLMDSRGLGVLLIAHNRVQRLGGRLSLCNVNGQTSMLFELAHMEKVFDIYLDRADFETSLR